MLTITIPEMTLWDEANEEFIYTKETTIELEHSLVSVAKWESKWCKVFLTDKPKTPEETLDYVKCMTLTTNVPDDIYRYISDENVAQINNYIKAPMTASFITEDPNQKSSNEPVTSELIYYWMIALNIPFECQYWHLNRLIMLIKVCNHKNKAPKKMNKKDLMSRNAALNRSRRNALHSRG